MKKMIVIGLAIVCACVLAGFSSYRKKRALRISFVGDIMLGRVVNEEYHKAHYDPLAEIRPLLKRSDIVIGNLECTFTRSIKSVPKVFNFKAHPDLAHILANTANGIRGFDALNMANNHSFDFSQEGFIDTITNLDSLKIAHFGAGQTEEEAYRGIIIKKKGVKIGIFGFTDNEPSWKAEKEKPGIAYLNIDQMTAEEEVSLCKKVQDFKQKEHLDLLIVSLHWGPNMRLRPSERFVSFAHKLVDCGVDIIHGHSAHVAQGIEWYNNGIVLYDTGDFIDDYAIDSGLRNDLSALFTVTVTKKKLISVELTPIAIKNLRTMPAKGEDFSFFADRIKTLSKEHGTIISQKNGILISDNA